MSISREQFVKDYAANSGLSAKYAALGILDVGGKTIAAMPCGCGEEGCKGWSMVSADSIHDHLFFRAPEELRLAYHSVLKNSSGG